MLSFGKLKPLVRYYNRGARILSLGYYNGRVRILNLCRTESFYKV